MLYNFLNDLQLPINGVLHVGAHDGEELNSYKSFGIKNVIFVEANPTIYQRLLKRCSNHKDMNIMTFNVGISNKKSNDVKFYVTNNDSASSSILELKEHLIEYPGINVSNSINISTNTIDELINENSINSKQYNILNMDIQGAELHALLGAKNYLKECDAVYLEVNFREMYKNCGLISDIDSYLNSFDFKRIRLIDTGRGWGDALYVK